MPLAFAREAAVRFRQTAAVAPSSHYLTQAMVKPLRALPLRRVVEFGSGTGTITRALLRVLPADAVLFAFEINPCFAEHLRRTVADPRLTVFECGAEKASPHLARFGHGSVDAVVSSLAIGFLSDGQRSALMEGIVPYIGDDGVLTQYQYVHGLQYRDGRVSRFSTGQVLAEYFSRVEREIVWRNLPPARVFTCYGRR